MRDSFIQYENCSLLFTTVPYNRHSSTFDAIMASLLAFLYTGFVACVCAQTPDHNAKQLQLEMQKIINDAASYYNISFSASIALGTTSNVQFTGNLSSNEVEIFDDMVVVSAAAGYNDHKTGTKVDTNSLYPAGSITKLYTAVDLLIAAEEGLIDLDEPVYKYIDPWHAKQNPPVPTLLQLWNNDSTIQQVRRTAYLSGQKVYKS